MFSVALGTVACDLPPSPKQVTQEESAPAPVRAGSPPVPDAEDAPAPQKRASCERACLRGGDDSLTDRETCRLVCADATARPADPSLATTVVARFDSCNTTCQATSKTDTATCALTCGNAAVASLDSGATAADACMRSCLSTLPRCDSDCGGPGTKKTDRATCELQCRGVVRACLDRCEAESES